MPLAQEHHERRIGSSRALTVSSSNGTGGSPWIAVSRGEVDDDQEPRGHELTLNDDFSMTSTMDVALIAALTCIFVRRQGFEPRTQ